MSEATSIPALPPWVRKRDGRVVPFDPDVIAHDLFAAGEALGQVDPFLTRELTDGVLHFLAADCPESIPNTQWIAELTAKVVRELRQPRLAQAFSERRRPQEIGGPAQRPETETPQIAAKRGVEAYTLQHVFSRDLAAAHRDGLLVLSSLDAPRELAAAVLTPPEPSATLPALQLLDAILEARGGISGWLAFDGAEHLELEKGSPPLPRLLTPVLQASGLNARLHLNSAELPSWAARASHGPLFPEDADSPNSNSLQNSLEVVRAVLASPRERCPFAIDWHLSDADFGPEAIGVRGELLESMVRAALGDYPITFVFDRPRRPLSLGPGLDRLHGFLLMNIGLDLPRLLEHTGITDDVGLFLRKLASLARLAVSAGVQKRQYLRETLRERGIDLPFLRRGFLLDRARLIVTPLGLDRAVRTLTGLAFDEQRAGFDVACKILKTIDAVLAEEGERRLVDCGTDTLELLTSKEGQAPTRPQLTAAGRLHAVTSTGTIIAALGEEERLGIDQIVRLLEFAWRQTEIARLRFEPRPTPSDEPMLLG